MSSFKEKSFSERLSVAVEARKAQLEKFCTKPGRDDPATVERQAARRSAAIAWDARAAERKTASAQEAAKEAEQKLLRELHDAPAKMRAAAAESRGLSGIAGLRCPRRRASASHAR